MKAKAIYTAVALGVTGVTGIGAANISKAPITTDAKSVIFEADYHSSYICNNKNSIGNAVDHIKIYDDYTVELVVEVTAIYQCAEGQKYRFNDFWYDPDTYWSTYTPISNHASAYGFYNWVDVGEKYDNAHQEGLRITVDNGAQALPKGTLYKITLDPIGNIDENTWVGSSCYDINVVTHEVNFRPMDCGNNVWPDWREIGDPLEEPSEPATEPDEVVTTTVTTTAKPETTTTTTTTALADTYDPYKDDILRFDANNNGKLDANDISIIVDIYSAITKGEDIKTMGDYLNYKG